MLYHHAKQRYLFIACALVAGIGGCEPGGGHEPGIHRGDAEIAAERMSAKSASSAY